MALSAKKFDSEPFHLRIVKNDRAKRNNLLIGIGISLLIVAAIAIIPVFINSIDDNPKNEVSVDS